MVDAPPGQTGTRYRWRFIIRHLTVWTRACACACVCMCVYVLTRCSSMWLIIAATVGHERNKFITGDMEKEVKMDILMDMDGYITAMSC